MPNLRHYYRVPRKGRVVKVYPSDGSYWLDVQPLRNDDSVDPAEPVISRVEIPVLWGGPDRGIICPPTVGTLCDITYYDGDPNWPRISNFRWAGNRAPACELGALIIQQSPGSHFLIKPDGSFEIAGPLHVTGPITCDADVSDSVRSMAGDRSIYNSHTHGSSPVPGAQM